MSTHMPFPGHDLMVPSLHRFDAQGVFFLALDPTDRLSIATTIERLINVLDAMDPDPELEDDDTEDCDMDSNLEGAVTDLENDPAEFGIGDFDGLMEQVPNMNGGTAAAL